MIDIVLFNPQIAPNTGNVMRLSANTGFHVHLVEPLGFKLEEKRLRRAGLDYHDMSRVTIHKDYSSLLKNINRERIFAITTKGSRHYSNATFHAGDVLLFGSETHGLTSEIHASIPEHRKLVIPMQKNNRSLNLSNSVAILAYEAWRQLNFEGSKV
jgi:tRNA (cytidine/uridine-2'-O-)-methyltransferase